MGVRGEREKELASVLSGSESVWFGCCCVGGGFVMVGQFFVVIGSVGVVCFAHVLQRLYKKSTLDTVLGRGLGGAI